jgi:hypothetical protein
MIGGAILPSLLKQDPRYFYKGTGTTRSRILYALAMRLSVRVTMAIGSSITRVSWELSPPAVFRTYTIRRAAVTEPD